MYKPAIFYPQTMEEICDILRGSTKQNYPDKRQGFLPFSCLMSESTFFLLSPKSFSSRTCLQVWRVDWANCYVIFSDFLSDESRMENNIWKWTTHDFRQTSANSRQYSEYIFYRHQYSRFICKLRLAFFSSRKQVNWLLVSIFFVFVVELSFRKDLAAGNCLDNTSKVSLFGLWEEIAKSQPYLKGFICGFQKKILWSCCFYYSLFIF